MKPIKDTHKTFRKGIIVINKVNKVFALYYCNTYAKYIQAYIYYCLKGCKNPGLSLVAVAS